MHSTPVLKSQLKGLAAAEGNAKNTDDLLRCIAREVSNYRHIGTDVMIIFTALAVLSATFPNNHAKEKERKRGI